jgi:hypothetical protein
MKERKLKGVTYEDTIRDLRAMVHEEVGVFISPERDTDRGRIADLHGKMAGPLDGLKVGSDDYYYFSVGEGEGDAGFYVERATFGEAEWREPPPPVKSLFPGDWLVLYITTTDSVVIEVVPPEGWRAPSLHE